MKKAEEDRSTEERKPICSKCANVSSVLLVFVICKNPAFVKCTKTIVKNRKNEGGKNGKNA